MSANNSALLAFEATLNKDLNGDGFVTIGANGSLELNGTTELVSFASSHGLLKLDQPSTFTGQIAGFSGDGTLPGSDQIDLKGIAFATLQVS